MRKFTILFSLLIATVFVFAQSNNNMLAKKYQDPSVVVVSQPGTFVPVATKGALSEDFEGTTFPPAGWTVIDEDGDGSNWEVYSNSPHSGTQCAASASWVGGTVLTPTNHLVTPPLNVVTGDSIVYWVAPQDPSYPADHYGIFISTTGNSASDFSTKLFEETLTTPDSIWVRRAFSLDTYNGQTIYISFKHFNCTDHFVMKIDDVTGPTTAVGIENQVTIDNSVLVYPNPVKDLLNVKSDNKILSIRIFNIIGQTVITQKPGVTHASVNVNNLNTGMYFIEVETSTGIKSQKIAITK